MSPAAVEQASASTAQPPQGMPLHRLALQALAELRTGGPARKRRPKKQARRTGTSADAAVTEAPSKRSMSTKADAAPVVHPSPSQSYLRTANDPRVRILEPVSSLPSYLSPSSLHARRLVAPPRRQPPLLILDLNGTLVWRSKSRAWASANRRPSRRPYLGTFLDYVFSSALVAGQWRRRWEVMVWSSAQPHNVATMASWAGFDVSDLEKPTELETVTPSPAASESRQPAESTVEDVDALADRLADMSLKPPPQSRKPLAIWTRQHMDLNRRDYGQRVQTYKNLDKVWEKMRWTDPETGEEARWGPENTLLVDDSEVKAALQPHNRVPIQEYKGDHDTDLLHLVDVLDGISRSSNFAALLARRTREDLGFGGVYCGVRASEICTELGIKKDKGVQLGKPWGPRPEPVAVKENA